MQGKDAVKELTDEALLVEHLAGKPGSFEQLVSRYADELYGFLYRFVGNGALAEDLVQETFLQVHLSVGSFDPARRFRPWLYTIAANKARDMLRSRGRRTEQSLDARKPDEDRPSTSQVLEAEVPAADEVADEQERKRLVQTLIQRMPDHLRMILTLGYYQQLAYAEIAEILDIPVGTVKSRLHAAVNHFGRLWRAEVDTGDPEQAVGEEKE